MKETKKERAIFIHDKILEVKRATKRSTAKLTLAIDDELAQRLIRLQLVNMDFFRDDFPIVGMMLNWTEVDYDPTPTDHADGGGC